MAVDPKLFEALLVLPAMLDELTGQVRESADALQEQVERIRGLMAALNPGTPLVPERSPSFPERSFPVPTPGAERERLRLSPEEEARKAQLLKQFNGRSKMREEIEQEIEAGA